MLNIYIYIIFTSVNFHEVHYTGELLPILRSRDQKPRYCILLLLVNSQERVQWLHYSVEINKNNLGTKKNAMFKLRRIHRLCIRTLISELF